LPRGRCYGLARGDSRTGGVSVCMSSVRGSARRTVSATVAATAVAAVAANTAIDDFRRRLSAAAATWRPSRLFCSTRHECWTLPWCTLPLNLCGFSYFLSDRVSRLEQLHVIACGGGGGTPNASRDASLTHPAGVLMPDHVLAVALSSTSSGHQQAVLARAGGIAWAPIRKFDAANIFSL